MPHVVTESCYDCRYTDCVNVCPVECFYADDKMLYIDADECIDCEACVTECPVEAIILDRNVKDVAERTRLLKLNADRVGFLRDNDGHISDPEPARKGEECITTKKEREAAGGAPPA